MSSFAPTKSINPSKVHYSQYIRTENQPDEPTTPPKPAAPAEPEAK